MDYFNVDERDRQEAFARRRDRFFSPAVKVLARTGITPNHVTLFGIALLLVACAGGPDDPWVAPVFLVLYCLMDGLDGPLARAKGSASRGGAFLDIIADQLGAVLVPAAAVYHLGTHGTLATLFTAFYIAFITLAVVANERGLTPPRFIRIKYVLYGVYSLSIMSNIEPLNYFFLSIISNIELLNYFFALFGAYYAWMFAVFTRLIYRDLSEVANANGDS